MPTTMPGTVDAATAPSIASNAFERRMLVSSCCFPAEETTSSINTITVEINLFIGSSLLTFACHTSAKLRDCHLNGWAGTTMEDCKPRETCAVALASAEADAYNLLVCC